MLIVGGGLVVTVFQNYWNKNHNPYHQTREDLERGNKLGSHPACLRVQYDASNHYWALHLAPGFCQVSRYDPEIRHLIEASTYRQLRQEFNDRETCTCERCEYLLKEEQGGLHDDR